MEGEGVGGGGRGAVNGGGEGEVTNPPESFFTQSERTKRTRSATEAELQSQAKKVNAGRRRKRPKRKTSLEDSRDKGKQLASMLVVYRQGTAGSKHLPPVAIL